MAATPGNCVPCKFEAGNAVSFSLLISCYPAADYTATIYFSLNGTAALNVAATEVDGVYLFTLTSVQTATLAPGIYSYAVYVVDGSLNRYSGPTGQLTVTPNLAVSQTPSTAQAMVTNLETCLKRLALSKRVTVSFNNQSYTYRNLSELQSMYAFWKSQLIAEQKAAAAARGQAVYGDYAPRFVNSGFAFPFNRPGC